MNKRAVTVGSLACLGVILGGCDSPVQAQKDYDEYRSMVDSYADIPASEVSIVMSQRYSGDSNDIEVPVRQISNLKDCFYHVEVAASGVNDRATGTCVDVNEHVIAVVDCSYKSPRDYTFINTIKRDYPYNPTNTKEYPYCELEMR